MDCIAIGPSGGFCPVFATVSVRSKNYQKKNALATLQKVLGVSLENIQVHTIPSPLAQNKFKRHHKPKNVYSRSLSVHAETVERMRITGLSAEDFERANARRHWLAMLRVWKVHLANPAITSINKLRMLAGAAWRTAKHALEMSYSEVLENVRQAFIHTGSSLTKEKETKGFIANAFKPKPAAADQSGEGRLWALIKRCRERGNKQQEEAAPILGSEEVKNARQEDLRKQSLVFQAELAQAKARKGDGWCWRLTKTQISIWFNRKSMESRFEEEKRQVQSLIEWKKKKFKRGGNACHDQIPNSQAYRRITPALLMERDA